MAILALPSSPGGAPPVRALAFVWRCWRGISAREWNLWLLLGMGIGLAQGLANALMTRQGQPWHGFVSSFIDALGPAIILLLCIAVARSVATTERRRWVPYAIAAVTAVFVAEVLGVLVFTPVFNILTGCDCKWEGVTKEQLAGWWLNVPPRLLMCTLGAFAYMYAIDAQQRAEKLQSVQLEHVRLGRQSYQSRLQAMQARVDPQFLFDTLEHIEQLYEVEGPFAERVLDDLIVYLRAALPSLRTSDSTVSAELALVRAWLDIMKVRLNERLTFTISSAAGDGGAQIPPMIVLPLVDCALRSVLRSSGASETIGIEVSSADGQLRIVVSSSGHGFTGADAAADVEKVRERLRTLFADRASLSIRDEKYQAPEAIVLIPDERTP